MTCLCHKEWSDHKRPTFAALGVQLHRCLRSTGNTTQRLMCGSPTPVTLQTYCIYGNKAVNRRWTDGVANHCTLSSSSSSPPISMSIARPVGFLLSCINNRGQVTIHKQYLFIYAVLLSTSPNPPHPIPLSIVLSSGPPHDIKQLCDS